MICVNNNERNVLNCSHCEKQFSKLSVILNIPSPCPPVNGVFTAGTGRRLEVSPPLAGLPPAAREDARHEAARTLNVSVKQQEDIGVGR